MDFEWDADKASSNIEKHGVACSPDSELRPEYDFSRGVRGKHHAAYREGTNVVLLEADIAKAFPDSASVNRALRLLLDLAKHEVAAKRPA